MIDVKPFKLDLNMYFLVKVLINERQDIYLDNPVEIYHHLRKNQHDFNIYFLIKKFR